MTKENWVRHIEETSGVVRPSISQAPEVWRAAVRLHREQGCKICRERAVTRNRQLRQRERDDALRSLGLVKVRGAQGGVYWE